MSGEVKDFPARRAGFFLSDFKNRGVSKLLTSKSKFLSKLAQAVLVIGLGGRKFDAEAYSAWRGDLVSQGIDPNIHAALSGIKQFFFGMRGQFEFTLGKPRDEKLDWVLVVTHDMSRTGAPILALNLAKELSSKFNVVTLSLGRGTLHNNFRDTSSVLAEDYGNRLANKMFKRRIRNLCERYNFAFAFINSVESVYAVEALAEHGVESTALIHEYASYSRSDEDTFRGLNCAKVIIFSSQLTKESFLSVLDQNSEQLLEVLHQGHCEIPQTSNKHNEVDRKFRNAVDAYFETRNSEVPLRVLGAGYVQFRKGVDLFIALAAQTVLKPGLEGAKFLWVGDGFNKKSVEYGSYLQDQIERSNLSSNVSLVKSSEDFEYALANCDVFALTSRLDPFPNVVIDSLKAGKPVFSFQDCSGFPEIFEKSSSLRGLISPYLRVDVMADQLERFAHNLNEGSRSTYTQDIGDLFRKEFSFEGYVRQLVSITQKMVKN